MTTKQTTEIEVPVETSLPQMLEERGTPYFLEPLILLAKHKFFIVGSVGSAVIVSVIVSLLLPNYYTAESKVLPPQQEESLSAAMLGELGQLGGLLSAATGKDLLKNPSDVYLAMLRSRTVTDRMVDRFHLMSLYNKQLRVDARKRLDSLTEFTAAKDGTIAVAVQDRDPKRAADMANAYFEELETLSRTLVVTDAGKRRLFFEREAKAANEELAAAEEAMKATEERTGIIQLDSQSKVMLDAYAQLRAQVTLNEVQVESMRAYATPDNPDFIRAQQHLAALRSQVARYEQGQGGRPIGEIALEKVPGKALEYVRKLREVKYREALLQLMLKQYEVARIDEGRNASMIQVLDRAVAPERKSSPMRAVIVLISTFLVFLLAIAVVYIKETVERAMENPHYLARLQLLKFYLSRGRESSAREA